MTSILNSQTRAQLSGVSCATLCTALFKRGLRNQFIQNVHSLRVGLPNMVGPAFTLRYIPAREDLNPGDIVVGDGEGVVVIPAHLADDIAAEAHEMTVFEEFVMAQVRQGTGIFGLYPPIAPATKQTFVAWRKAQDR